MQNNKDVKDIMICIVDDDILDEYGWIYSDTAYIVTNLKISEIEKLFTDKLLPNEITEVNKNDVDSKIEVPKNYNLVCLWWD